MLIYSRDVSMAALSHVSLLFRAIADGTFDPDASRSVVLAGVIAAQKVAATHSSDAVQPASPHTPTELAETPEHTDADSE
eukprot:659388-Amphidinium_carterae.1